MHARRELTTARWGGPAGQVPFALTGASDPGGAGGGGLNTAESCPNSWCEQRAALAPFHTSETRTFKR